MKVLIVDDDFISRKKMQTIMGQYGEADTAASGSEAMVALEYAEEQGKPYDVIVMDVMMPGVDGIEALKRMRDREKDRRVAECDAAMIIMVTSSENEELKEFSRHEGCNAYIVKPVTRQKVESAFREAGALD